jgi:type II secretory pathway pseudopilin PulG
VTTVPRRTVPREGGYNLVILSVLVMVLLASLAMIVPELKLQDQRSREEETIFRGLQYAEAIRVFQLRQGRLPNSPEELLTIEPRCIRQLWDDPLTDDGQWGLVRGTLDPSGGAGADQGNGEADEDEDGAGRPRVGSRRIRDGQRSDTEILGPISGVFTRAEGAPVKIFFGAESYDEWVFTPQFLPQPVVSADGEYVSRPTADWVGRPFRGGLVAPGVQGPAGSQDLGDGAAPRDLFGRDDDDEDEEEEGDG